MSYNKKTWNYDHPINSWESWPWWFRWPLAVAASLYIGSALLLPVLIWLK